MKKEIWLHQLFSKLHNYFSTNHHALQYTSANAALVFEIRPLKNRSFVFETISSLHTSPYPPSHCTHINTLITTNHFLTADFTLPSVSLYSHQHTDYHKPFPHCTLHLTQRLFCTHINTLITTNHFLTAHFTLPTVLLYSHQHTDHHKPFPHCTLHLTHRLSLLTSTHWSPQTISSLHTSHYPPSYCTTLPQNIVYPALLLLMRKPRLPVVDWTDAPADLNGLVRFVERRNVVPTRVPLHFYWPLQLSEAQCCTVWRLLAWTPCSLVRAFLTRFFHLQG